MTKRSKGRHSATEVPLVWQKPLCEPGKHYDDSELTTIHRTLDALGVSEQEAALIVAVESGEIEAGTSYDEQGKSVIGLSRAPSLADVRL